MEIFCSAKKNTPNPSAEECPCSLVLKKYQQQQQELSQGFYQWSELFGDQGPCLDLVLLGSNKLRIKLK